MESNEQIKLIEYGGFKLNIRELSSFLVDIRSNPQSSIEQLKKFTGIGKSKIENFRYYLRDFGLLNKSTFTETNLFGAVYKGDYRLRDDFTLWIILYGWSRKEGNPLLHYLINYSENSVTVNKLEELFIKWAIENSFKTDYDSTVSGLIRRTINALTDADAFQNLTLFVESNGRVSRAEAYNVHPLLLAYILYDNSRGRHSISLPELVDEPGNIGKFFGYTIHTIENSLTALENMGVIKRVQHANLNMIELLYKGTPLAFVERYYEEY